MRLTNVICALLDLWEDVNKIRKDVDNIQIIDNTVEEKKECIQIKLKCLNTKIHKIMSDLRIIKNKYVHDNTNTPITPNIRSDAEAKGK